MDILLSICIPTLQRGEYISTTLDSIVPQMNDQVELVIVDGGSTDQTPEIIEKYQKIYKNIRYIRKEKKSEFPSNEGFDRDCNYAVEMSKGKYCWLMTDDDLLVDGAITRILSKVPFDYDLIVVNADVRSIDMKSILLNRRLNIQRDIEYQNCEWQKLASCIGNHLTFVGSIIIKRCIWMERDRKNYFGTGFVHVGVIFQEPLKGNSLVISDPLVSIRYGNAMWGHRTFKIWMQDWPRLVWSFDSLREEVKLSACSKRDPASDLIKLIWLRTIGRYSINEYEKYVKPNQKTIFKSFIQKLIAIAPQRPLYYMVRIVMYKYRVKYPLHYYDFILSRKATY